MTGPPHLSAPGHGLPVSLPGRGLPVLYDVDVAVVGGTLAGVAAAVALARAGRRVAVLEEGYALATDLTSANRPWLTVPRRVPGLLAPLVPGGTAPGAVLPLRPAAVKLHLEDELLGAGGELLYGVRVLTEHRRDGVLRGLVLADVSGRQLVGCGAVLDARGAAPSLRADARDLRGAALASRGAARATRDGTSDPCAAPGAPTGTRGGAPGHERGRAMADARAAAPGDVADDARTAGTAGGARDDAMRAATGDGRPGGPAAVWSVEFDGAGAVAEEAVRHPAADGAEFVDGCRGPGHLYALFALPGGADRRAVVRAAGRLLREHPAFAGARLGAVGRGPLSAPYAPGEPAAETAPGRWTLPPRPYARGLGDAFLDPCAAVELGTAAGSAMGAAPAPPARAAGGAPYAANSPVTAVPAAPGEADAPASAPGAFGAPEAGAAAGIGAGPPRVASTSEVPGEAHAPSAPGAGRASATAVSEQDAPRPGAPYRREAVDGLDVPCLPAVEVLVVGGGTAGSSAALAAAREGVRVRLVECGPGAGGTGTYGGVHSYWFGRREARAAEVQRATRRAHRELGLRGGVGAWNIEAKALALDDELRASGVEVHYDTRAFAALCQGQRVTGAVLAGPGGPVAAEADVVVDATGEADLAAWCGAGCVHGAAGTHTVMWASLARFETPAATRNNFGGLADLTDVCDATRAVLAARRRSPGMHDHGERPVTREGRHLEGEAVLTFTDQLTGRRWPDVVGVHFANHDLKGKGEALWPQLGLIPPNLRIEVPYRALLPRGLDGLLVTGKALSATHDALPALRMQADLENLGAVTGIAAAACVHGGVPPRELDVAVLQQHLVKAGLLPEGCPERRVEPPLPLPDALRELAARLPLHAYSDMGRREVFSGRIPFVDLVLDPRPEATGRLAEALAGSAGELRLALAQILVCRGHPAGADVLYGHLARALAGAALPRRDARIREAQLPPDQSAMPDGVYLLNTLALARQPRTIGLWERVAELVEVTPHTLRDASAGVFFWVEAVCAGAERLGDPRAVPALLRLHRRPALHGRQRPGVEPDDFQERQAMLELALARALAQCGSRTGVDTLIAYLADGRAPLSAQAHSRLLALYDLDARAAPGRDAAAWRRLVRERGTPPARPLPWRHDPHRADLPPGLRIGSTPDRHLRHP